MDRSASKRPSSGGSSSGSHKHNRVTSASAVPTDSENNIVQSIMLKLKPLVKEMIRGELNNQLVNVTAMTSLTQSPSLQDHQALEPPPPVNVPLYLAFPENLKQPIYTLNKLVFVDNSPLRVVLVPDDPTVHPGTAVPLPIKIELVVLDGDFPPLHRDVDDKIWTTEEFKSRLIKERKGKPLLLVGNLVATLRPDGGCGGLVMASFDEVKFTDNSRSIRSGKFRLGVRVIPGSCGSAAVRIREAVSEEFTVRERRGQSQEKHHPPRLNDPVWRLHGIRKGGPRERELLENGILSVEHMLQVHKLDPQRLEKILPSKKHREAVLDHATTCEDFGNKVYKYPRGGDSFFFDPTCCILGAEISEKYFTANQLTENFSKAYIDQVVEQAYSNWSQLQVLTL